MNKIPLVIITGFPATGKTSIGKKLASELMLPLISKDDIKELLFDNFGWQDREWSKKIGGSSYDLLYYITESLLAAKKPLIIETNFNAKFANNKLTQIIQKYNCKPLQIRCFADGEVLFKRFKTRAESDGRHPGHVDSANLAEWHPILLQGKIEALDVGGDFLDIDTTDFNKIDYSSLTNSVKKFISN